MAEIYNSMRDLASGYARQRIALDDFRVKFAGLYFYARQAKDDREANLLAGKIAGPLAEYGRGHRSEESLRGIVLAAIGLSPELATPIRPFDRVMYCRPKIGDTALTSICSARSTASLPPRKPPSSALFFTRAAAQR